MRLAGQPQQKARDRTFLAFSPRFLAGVATGWAGSRAARAHFPSDEAVITPGFFLCCSVASPGAGPFSAGCALATPKRFRVSCLRCAVTSFLLALHFFFPLFTLFSVFLFNDFFRCHPFCGDRCARKGCQPGCGVGLDSRRAGGGGLHQGPDVGGPTPSRGRGGCVLRSPVAGRPRRPPRRPSQAGARRPSEAP